MKKIISLSLCLLLAVGSICLPVSALGSPEVDDVISDITATDNNGDDVDVVFTREEDIDEDLKPEDKDDKLIAQYGVEIEGSPEYPVTVRMRVAGIKKGAGVYIMAKDSEDKVKKITATVLAGGKIEFKLDKAYTRIALITDKKTASQIGESDKTGDFTTPIAIAVMLVSLCGVVALKKKEA